MGRQAGNYCKVKLCLGLPIYCSYTLALLWRESALFSSCNPVTVTRKRFSSVQYITTKAQISHPGTQQIIEYFLLYLDTLLAGKQALCSNPLACS